MVHAPRLGDPGPWVKFSIAFVLSNLVAFLIGFVSEGAATRWVKRTLYEVLARRGNKTPSRVQTA